MVPPTVTLPVKLAAVAVIKPTDIPVDEVLPAVKTASNVDASPPLASAPTNVLVDA